MNKINVTIDGILVKVPSNYTILDAAKVAGIDIPRLCFLKDINETSACRLCVVEVEGIRTLKNSCTVAVADNMVVKTNTPRVRVAVKKNLELLAGNHKFECWKCSREHNCEFLRLLRKYGIPNNIADDPETFSRKDIITNITDTIVIDSSKCILCGRCISTCQKLAGTNILDFNFRGSKTYVGPALNHPMDDSGCIYCGKCIQACPVGALREKDDIDKAMEVVENNDFYTVACMAPAVRASLGEEFGNKLGTNTEGKLYAALDKLGFDDITDVNFAADVTIMEEGTEFIERLTKFQQGDKSVFPMFTSCSPGWIRYIELYYPEYLSNLSTCKSPQQMQGALIKHYYSGKIGIPKEKIKVVSIMPCIAKKHEAKRPEMESDGIRDIDVVLTTRELARWIKRADINFNGLKSYIPQSPMAKYTGAGVIFGATGGVMEAALRTVRDILEKENYKNVDITPVRGVNKGIKEATLTIAGLEVTVAVVHGGANFPEMFKRIKEGKKQYAFIEFMGCTGGCINGGGQPIVPAHIAEGIDIRAIRAKVLYNSDKSAVLRKSHDNPAVQEVYKEFLGQPCGHLSHKLLHTHYEPKQKYSKE